MGVSSNLLHSFFCALREEKKVMNLRSFAEILASRQGGVNLKPGHSITKELSADQVKEIFGHIPAAVSGYGVTITVRPTAKGTYRLTVNMEGEFI